MAQSPFFPIEEYDARLHNVRQSMAERGLDALLVTVPEHIYYLAGVSHWGFFAFHLLIVPSKGEMVVIARGMERMTMDVQLTNARFVGYGDLEDPAGLARKELVEMGFASARLGIEKNSLFLTLRIAEGIMGGLPQAQWIDASGLVFEHRCAQSARELAYTRRAAAVTDAMMGAALEGAGVGVTEKEIAAHVHRAMILADGEFPAFGPFIRSTPTLGIEHGTWTGRALEKGDVLFVELSGSVARYHAPMGRLLFVGDVPPGTQAMQEVCLEAFDRVVQAIRPGVTANDVYQAWQDRVDAAGLAHYRRHHCGYMVGSAFPPAWSGGGVPIGLRSGSPLLLRAGMVFHLMSWLMHTGRPGDYFVSDAAVVTEDGCEVLIKVPQQVHIV